MTKRIRVLAIAAAVLFGAAIGLAVSLWFVPAGGPTLGGAAAIGGPFTLVDQNGETRTERDFRGRFMLVTFGYTHCPDICPVTVQAIGDTLEQLGPAADQVAGIFVSVDPQRDTPAALKDYVQSVSPRIVALTGSPAQIAAAARAYRVYYRINGDPSRDQHYAVDHTALLYLMDRDGRFVTHFTHQTPAATMVAAIRRVL